ncbi:hypothetical protein Tco_1393148 [Tanacetum coccineum]
MLVRSSWFARTWTAFGGNTCNFGSIGEETDKTTALHHLSLEEIRTEPGDDVAGIKRRRHDFQQDNVRVLAMASAHNRLKEDPEYST